LGIGEGRGIFSTEPACEADTSKIEKLLYEELPPHYAKSLLSAALLSVVVLSVGLSCHCLPHYCPTVAPLARQAQPELNLVDKML